jgi:hypothetical protein
MWTNDTKSNSVFDDGLGYLLQEDFISFILLEDGGKIILDQSYNSKESIIFTNDDKTTSIFTYDDK